MYLYLFFIFLKTQACPSYNWIQEWKMLAETFRDASGPRPIEIYSRIMMMRKSESQKIRNLYWYEPECQ